MVYMTPRLKELTGTLPLLLYQNPKFRFPVFWVLKLLSTKGKDYSSLAAIVFSNYMILIINGGGGGGAVLSLGVLSTVRVSIFFNIAHIYCVA